MAKTQLFFHWLNNSFPDAAVRRRQAWRPMPYGRLSSSKRRFSCTASAKTELKRGEMKLKESTTYTRKHNIFPARRALQSSRFPLLRSFRPHSPSHSQEPVEKIKKQNTLFFFLLTSTMAATSDSFTTAAAASDAPNIDSDNTANTLSNNTLQKKKKQPTTKKLLCNKTQNLPNSSSK